MGDRARHLCAPSHLQGELVGKSGIDQRRGVDGDERREQDLMVGSVRGQGGQLVEGRLPPGDRAG